MRIRQSGTLRMILTQGYFMERMSQYCALFLNILSKIESQRANSDEFINNLKIAFDILESYSVSPLRITFPTSKEEIAIIDIEASIETIVDMNFELVNRIMALREKLTDHPVYFSAKRNITWGLNLKELSNLSPP